MRRNRKIDNLTEYAHNSDLYLSMLQSA